MPKRIAMLAYPGVQHLDVAGPLEVFARTSPWLREHAGHVDYVARAVAAAKWRAGATSGSSSDWSFADDAGHAWTGQLAIEPPSGEKREYVVRPKIARAG